MKRTVIILIIIALAAFLLRVLPHISAIYTNWGIAMFDTDSYYHLRLIEYMVPNFPHFLTFDQYAAFPDGAMVGFRPVLQWLVAGVSLVIGLGHPSSHLIQSVAVWIPPILGTVLIIPVYFLGKEVFSQRTGLIAAGLVAIMPTELLHRSFLGYLDQHIVEVLLGVCVILFLIKAHKKWAYSLVSGVFLGLYLWNWHGALFLIGIIFLWYVIKFLYDYQKGIINKQLSLATFICLITGIMMFIPYMPYSQQKEWLAAPLAFIILAMPYAAILIKNKLVFYSLLTSIATIFCVLVFYVYPSIGDIITALFTAVFWGFGSTIQETQPTDFNLLLFTLGFASLLAVFGVIFAYKHKVNLLFAIWSLVLIAAMLGQRRWGYYTTIPIALLASFCLDRVLANTGKQYKEAVFACLAIVIMLSIIPGNLGLSKTHTDINAYWYQACEWLREDTPEPFDNPTNALLAKYSALPDGLKADIKKIGDSYYHTSNDSPSYGVLAWWDYGHYIIEIGHRVPLSSPTYPNYAVSRFLVAQSPEEADRVIQGLNIKYVMLDAIDTTLKYYAFHWQAYGTTDGWQQTRPGSMAVKLYSSNNYGDWQFVKQVGTVRIYERIGGD